VINPQPLSLERLRIFWPDNFLLKNCLQEVRALLPKWEFQIIFGSSVVDLNFYVKKK
jgi:hypothetical protein